MGTVVVPWTPEYQLDEALFRHAIRTLLAAEYTNLYIFGTAGEGHAVDDAQFECIARVFSDEMRTHGADPMVGVISLSLSTVVRRIAWARETLGVRRFQISLPSWSALEEVEMRTFFDHVLASFEDCEFMHYNTPRAKRVVSAAEYAAIADDHPNLVATKNPTDSMQRLRDLLTIASELRHFPGEVGFAYGSTFAEPGLLISLATINLEQGKRFFAAGQARDLEALSRMDGELHQISARFHQVNEGRALIDSAYDKVLWRLHDARFPLRLLPPHAGVSESAADAFLAWLQERYPDWAP
jgi:dihydrodipicolinate synthase/N-acetylneuraminate lyase